MGKERILVIQLRQLGDILLTTPCFKAIKQERPQAEVTFLSHAMGKLVVDQCPYVEEHFFYDERTSLGDHLKLARTLRQRRFDLVVDFMGNPRSAFYTLATGARHRVAFRSARRWAYTQVVPRPSPDLYIVRAKLQLLAAAGMRPTESGLILPWFETHVPPVARLTDQEPLFREAPLRIVLSPTHRRLPRRWPPSRYARLADRLVREWGAAVVWLWGPGEEAEVAAERALCQEATIMAPKTSFREMAALLANCDLFVGNSNGPSHVATAVGLSSLQLHGPTDGRSWCPASERHRFVQAPSMEALTMESVWTELAGMRALAENQARERKSQGLRLSWRDQ